MTFLKKAFGSFKKQANTLYKLELSWSYHSCLKFQKGNCYEDGIISSSKSEELSNPKV